MHTKRVVMAGLLLACTTVCSADEPSAPELGQCWWPALELTLAKSTEAAPPHGDFGDAVNFLEVNTGIESGLQMSFVGYLVDRKKLRRAVERWTGWFLENYAYLYWDSEKHVYLVDEQARSTRVPTSRLRGPSDGNCQPILPTCEEVFGSEAPICKMLKSNHGA